MADIWNYRAKKMEIAWELANDVPVGRLAIGRAGGTADQLVQMRLQLMKLAKEGLDEMFPEHEELGDPDYVPGSKQIKDD